MIDMMVEREIGLHNHALTARVWWIGWDENDGTLRVRSALCYCRFVPFLLVLVTQLLFLTCAFFFFLFPSSS